MRIIIAGSREFNDYELLVEKTKQFIKDIGNPDHIQIVSGHARGTDLLGERFANEFYYALRKFPADWDSYGRSAGMIRNKQMAEYAKMDDGVLLAFWDEKSKGTKNMIDLCMKMNMRVHVVLYKNCR